MCSIYWTLLSNLHKYTLIGYLPAHVTLLRSAQLPKMGSNTRSAGHELGAETPHVIYLPQSVGCGSFSLPVQFGVAGKQNDRGINSDI